MSDYLKTPGKFDSAINRRGIHHVRSARLKDLVNARFWDADFRLYNDNFVSEPMRTPPSFVA